jgi:hypothetical protein
MRRRLAPKKSADQPSRTYTVREGFWLSFLLRAQFRNKSVHFFGEVSRAEALGIKTRRLPGRFCRAFRIGFSRWDTIVAYTNKYPILAVKRSVNLRSASEGK